MDAEEALARDHARPFPCSSRFWKILRATLVSIVLLGSSFGAALAQDTPCGQACPSTLEVEFAYRENIYSGHSVFAGMDGPWLIFDYEARAWDGSIIYGSYELSQSELLAGPVLGYYSAYNITFTYEEGGGSDWVDDPNDIPPGGSDELPDGPYYLGSVDVRDDLRRVARYSSSTNLEAA
jgi:hypothetical protein